MAALPLVWAQAAQASTRSLAPLALRRWYGSLTLSSPDPVPTWYGLWLWVGALGGLLVLAMLLQGPARALGQALDVPGHYRLLSDALARLRRSSRVVTVTIGMTVLAWTAGQVRTYGFAQGQDDLVLLKKSRSVVELAAEQGFLASLTPLRDLLALGDNIPLVMLATILLFRAALARWNAPYLPPHLQTRPPSSWGAPACAAGALYVLYRLIGLTAGSGDLPPGGAVVVEVVLVPAAMLVIDGAVLSWILSELRSANLGETADEGFDAEGALTVMPGAMVACLAAMPARYLATAALLGSLYLPAAAGATQLGGVLRWQLSWGLADVQALAVLAAGLAGVVAWSRGGARGLPRGYIRLLGTEGGRLVAVMVAAGVAAAVSSGLAYVIVLSLPTQTWVLAAADGYAHYATLAVGMLALAAIVELGERALPLAALAPAAAENPRS